MQTDQIILNAAPNSLHEAAAKGDISKLEELLDVKKVNINTLHTETKITALAVACEKGQVKAVEFLLARKPDVKAGGLKMRRSVLDYAAEHSTIADLLLNETKKEVDKHSTSQKLQELNDADKIKIALLAYSLFNYYWSRNNKLKAETYFEIAFEITKSLPDTPVNVAPLQWLAATCFLKKGEIQQADKYYTSSLSGYETCSELVEGVFASQALQDTLFELSNADKTDDQVMKVFSCLFSNYARRNFNEAIQIVLNVGHRLLSKNKIAKATFIMFCYATNHQKISQVVDEAEIKRADILIARFILKLVYEYIRYAEYERARTILVFAKPFIGLDKDLDAEIKKASDDFAKCKKIFFEAKKLFDKMKVLEKIKKGKDFSKYKELSEISVDFLRKRNEFPEDLCPFKIEDFSSKIKLYIVSSDQEKLASDHAKWAVDLKLFYETALRVSEQKAVEVIIPQLLILIKEVSAAKSVGAFTFEKFSSVIVYIDLYLKCHSFLGRKINNQDINSIIRMLINFIVKMELNGQFHISKHPNVSTPQENAPAVIDVIERCLQETALSLDNAITLERYLITLLYEQRLFVKAFQYFQQLFSRFRDDEISDKTTALESMNILLYVHPQFTEEDIITVLKNSKELIQLLAKRKQTVLLRKIAPSYLTNCFNGALNYQNSGKYQVALEYYFQYLEFGYLLSEPNYFVVTEGISSCLVSLAASDKADAIELLAKKMGGYVVGLYNARHSIKWAVLLESLINTVLDIKIPSYRLKVLKALCRVLERLPSKEYAKEKVNVAYQLALSLYKQGNLQEDADEILSLLSTIRSHQGLMPKGQLPQDFNDNLLAIELALAEHLQKNAQPENALAAYNQILGGLLKDEKKSTLDGKTTAILQKATSLALQLAQQNDQQGNINAAICFYGEAIKNYEILKDPSNLAKAFANKQRLILTTTEQYLSKQKDLKAKAICEQILKDIQQQQANVPDGLQELNELSGAVVALLKKIDQIVKEKNQAFYSEQQKRPLINTKGENVPRNPLSHVSKQEVSDQDQVISVPVAANNVAADKAKLNQPPRATFLGGKVGQRLQADFLGEGQGNLYPVFDKNAKDIKRLKEENPYLYKEFKQAILEGVVAKKFGQSGLKHIGFWEAKVLSTIDRVVPSREAQEDQETGAKYLVFDTYVVDGFHRS